MSRRIKALDSQVVNRIAAGEIIIAPANALKEMLENSIDAQSTNIEVVARDGGLKLLQITDNGHGIDKEDFELLCKRYATSKLQTFEDLNSLETYGFRGEALASISHVARLAVISKTAQSPIAHRAQFLNGEVNQNSVKPIAGKNGTKLTVEDLFYNVPSRLRAFRSPSEEYSKILDIVGKYSIHCRGIAFLCKKANETHPSLVVQKDVSTKDRIRNIYGSPIANELLEVNYGTESPLYERSKRLGLQSFDGLVTNANYSSKKSIPPVFFINHRLVSCEPLRRAVIQVFHLFLPKGSHPFVYLSLMINPSMLDVNVHPTKREVRFLHEDEIVEIICEEIQAALTKVDSSRTYQVQTVLPVSLSSNIPPRATGPSSSIPTKRIYPQHIVRTDPKQQKLQAIPVSQLGNIEIIKYAAPSASEIEENEGISDEPPRPTREFSPVKLSSIKSLRRKIEAEALPAFTHIFENQTYVGIADYTRRLVAIQYDVKLLLVDYGAVSQYLFFQIGVSDFGNFGTIALSDKGLFIKDLLSIVATEEEQQKGFIVQTVHQLVSMRSMLADYFNLNITEDGRITSLPLLLKKYMPPMSKLPLFLHNLGTAINWESEPECLGGILTEIALFYVPLPLDESVIEKNEMSEMNRTVEHVLLPAYRKRLIATNSLKKYIVEIANLPGLYRVFERC